MKQFIGKKPRRKSNGCLIIIGLIILLAALGSAASGNKSVTNQPPPLPTNKPIMIVTAKPTQLSAPATSASRSQSAAPAVDSPASNCEPAYPDFCIPIGQPDLDCKDVAPHTRFKVLPPDPHQFDKDGNGIGCES